MIFLNAHRVLCFCTDKCQKEFQYEKFAQYYIPTVLIAVNNPDKPMEVLPEEGIELAKKHNLPFFECDTNGKQRRY